MKIKWRAEGTLTGKDFQLQSAEDSRFLFSPCGYFLIRLGCLSNQIFCSSVLHLIRLFPHVQFRAP